MAKKEVLDQFKNIRSELFKDPVYILSILLILIGALLTISVVGSFFGIIILIIGVLFNIWGRNRVKVRMANALKPKVVRKRKSGRRKAKKKKVVRRKKRK